MKIKRLIMILTSVAVLSSCVKVPGEIEDEDIRFSVLGDSYSTFEGYVTPRPTMFGIVCRPTITLM